MVKDGWHKVYDIHVWVENGKVIFAEVVNAFGEKCKSVPLVCKEDCFVVNIGGLKLETVRKYIAREELFFMSEKTLRIGGHWDGSNNAVFYGFDAC